MKMPFRAAVRLSASVACLAIAVPVAAQYGPTANRPAATLNGSEYVDLRQGNALVTATTGQIAALGGGGTTTASALNVTITSRDAQNRVSGYTSGATAYTVSYDSFGPSTIVGGGKTVTISRDANGYVTSMLTQ